VEGRIVKSLISRFVCEEEGQDIIEYSMLGAFISIVAWLTLQAIGQDVLNMYSDVNKATKDAAKAN
jgi:Flp pilus assembly pilin Flp